MTHGRADIIFAWARKLANLTQGAGIEWSDSWTDEDVVEVMSRSIRHFDEQEPLTTLFDVGFQLVEGREPKHVIRRQMQRELAFHPLPATPSD